MRGNHFPALLLCFPHDVGSAGPELEPAGQKLCRLGRGVGEEVAGVHKALAAGSYAGASHGKEKRAGRIGDRPVAAVT